MLVRQFAGNFWLNLCVSPKMRFFGRLLVKNRKKGLYFSFKRGMLYPTRVHRWIHDSPERFSLTHPVPLFFTMLFSSFTFLSFTLPAPQGARKAMTQPARVTAFSFCLRRMLPAQSVVACLKFCSFCKRHRRRIRSLLRAKREPEKHPLLSRRGRHELGAARP